MDLTYGDHGIFKPGKIGFTIVCKKVLTKEKKGCYNSVLSKKECASVRRSEIAYEHIA